MLTVTTSLLSNAPWSQDGALSQGIYIAQAREAWQTLTTDQRVDVGATFESLGSFLGPVSVSINGQDCELSPA